MSSTEIDSLFRLSLHSFGLLDDWIKEIKSSKLDKSYKVKIPKDLSIPVILVEINSNFLETDVRINSVEKIFSGRTILEIKSKDEIKLRADFDYDKSIFRSAGTAAFMLEKFELSSFESLEQDDYSVHSSLFSSGSVLNGKVVFNIKSFLQNQYFENIDNLGLKLYANINNNLQTEVHFYSSNHDSLFPKLFIQYVAP